MDPTSIDIHHEESGSAGEYTIRGDGAQAELTYRLTGDGVMVLDHTGVPKAWEGRGIGARLVARAVEDARAQGRRIQPACSYAAAQFRRHPEWSDLLA